MAYLSSEFDNSVYDNNVHEIGNLNSPYTLILGVFVSLVPKVRKVYTDPVRMREA